MEVTLKVPEGFDESDPIPVVGFSNGRIDPNNATNDLKMSFMRRAGERNPRKRVIVGQTDDIDYLGANFETEGSIYMPSYCKYMVGSLNKKTGIMTLHKAEMYHMTPKVKGGNLLSEDTPMTTDDTPNKSQFSREDYLTTHSKMVQSFGSERAKRALSAAKRNKMDSSLLEGTLASALDYADGEMRKADDNEPKHIPSQTISFLPPYEAAATTPEDVYKLSDIINDDIMSQLKAPAATLVRATPENVTEWREKESRTEFVLSQLANIPRGKKAYKYASMLVFCEYLINMYLLSTKEVEQNGLSQLWFIQEPIKQYLLTQYTERGPRTSCDTGILTNRMRDKILGSIILLGLMFNNYTLNTEVLQRDLKTQSTKMQDISRALGCTVTSGKAVKGQSKHFTLTLKLPLVFSTLPKGRRGRKKGV